MSDGIRAEGKRPSWMEQTHPATGERIDAYTMAERAHAEKQEVAALRARVAELEEELAEARAEIADNDASFDLRWKADMRAIKQWHEAGGDELTWPYHADLCVWLLERLDEARRDSERLDWLEANGGCLRHEPFPLNRQWWTRGTEPNYKRPHYATAREAIDSARREASDA